MHEAYSGLWRFLVAFQIFYMLADLGKVSWDHIAHKHICRHEALEDKVKNHSTIKLELTSSDPPKAVSIRVLDLQLLPS